ncbi:MAG: hypothetical protein ACI9OF_002967, partial [Saprospiraceae bacterium]
WQYYLQAKAFTYLNVTNLYGGMYWADSCAAAVY